MKRDTTQNKQTSNGPGSGFILGIFVGVLLTLLLTTKKGREILRELMKLATEKISDMDHSIERAFTEREKILKQEEEEIQGNDYVKPDEDEVREEVRYLATEPNEEKQEKIQEETDKAKEIPVKTPSRKAEEKNGKPEKMSKRSFFRKKEARD